MSLTRRLFLRSSAGAGAALAAVSAPIVAEAAQTEDPRILEIGQALPALVAEFDAATAQVERARRTFDATKPALPAELVFDRADGHGQGLTEQEWDFEHRIIYPEGGFPPRRIYSAEAIRLFHERDFGRDDRHSRKMKRLHDIAARYEAGWQDAHQQSGLPEALQRRDCALKALEQAARDVGPIAPHSLTGLVIKARTMEALARCGNGAVGTVMYLHGKYCIHDVLAVFGSEASA